MKHQSEAIIEFYRQLALLVRSGLELPGGMRAMAASCQDANFGAALTAMSQDLERGASLADAMAAQRRFFPKFHEQLIRGGEHAEVLPEALEEVGRISMQVFRLEEKMKESAAYPLFTSFLAVGLFALICRYHMPEFHEMYTEMTEAAPPLLSAWIFGFSDLLVRVWPLAVFGYVVAAIVAVWLITVEAGHSRGLRKWTARVPGLARMRRHLETARIAAIWGVLFRRNLPLTDTIRTAVDLTDDPALAADLNSFADHSEKGGSVAAFSFSNAVAAALGDVLAHVPGRQLATEFEAMADHYRERAETAGRWATLRWQMIMMATMALIVTLIIMGVFLPLLQLIQYMTWDM